MLRIHIPPPAFAPVQSACAHYATRLLALLLAVSLASAVGFAANEATKPNILLIQADDAGWGDYSFNGNTTIRTPHIDSIAQNGVALDRFYVCPVCSPTRGTAHGSVPPALRGDWGVPRAGAPQP